MMLDRFYPIFDSSDWLKRVLPLGVKFVQLRIKCCDPVILRSEISTAKKLCMANNCVLVVNDYWQIAIEEGCNFIHLGQEDLDTADIPAIRSAGIKLGISTHDHSELDRAISYTPDYIALGPIFPTILKEMKWQEQGLEKLTEWKKLIGNIPLIVIGGFNIERADGAFQLGADVVSVVTDITLNSNPEARVTEWLSKTTELA